MEKTENTNLHETTRPNINAYTSKSNNLISSSTFLTQRITTDARTDGTSTGHRGDITEMFSPVSQRISTQGRSILKTSFQQTSIQSTFIQRTNGSVECCSTTTLTTETSSIDLKPWFWHIIIGLGALVVILVICLCCCGCKMKKRKKSSRNPEPPPFNTYELSKSHEERLYTFPNSTPKPELKFGVRTQEQEPMLPRSPAAIHCNDIYFEDFQNAKKPLNEVHPSKLKCIKDRNQHRLPAPPPRPSKHHTNDTDDGIYIDMDSSLRRDFPNSKKNKSQVNERGFNATSASPKLKAHRETENPVMVQNQVEEGGMKLMPSLSVAHYNTEAMRSIASLKNIISTLPNNMILLNIEDSQSSRMKTLQTQFSTPYIPTGPIPSPLPPQTIDYDPSAASMAPDNPSYGRIPFRAQESCVNRDVISLSHNYDSSDDFSVHSGSYINDDKQGDDKYAHKWRGSRSSAGSSAYDRVTREQVLESTEIYDEVGALVGPNGHQQNNNPHKSDTGNTQQFSPYDFKSNSRLRASIDLK